MAVLLNAYYDLEFMIIIKQNVSQWNSCGWLQLSLMKMIFKVW